MRRDMELVRTILLDISNGKETIELDPLEPADKLYDYHIDILQQAGLIYFKNKMTDMVPRVYIDEPRLTWEGNNYLDNISDSKVWEQTKKTILSKGLELGDVPFSLIKELAKSKIREIIGFHN